MLNIHNKLIHISKKFLLIILVSLAFFASPKIFNNQVSAASSSALLGTLLGIEQTYDSSTDTTTTNLVSLHQTTGTPTVIGNSWESSIGPSEINLQPGATAINPDGHQFFVWIGSEILVLDTQTGVVLKQLPVDNAFGTSIQYESSTGRLLGIEQTYDSSTDTTTTNLVSLHQTTGTPTVIGNSWESSIGPSEINLQPGATAIDPDGHQFFVWIGSEILVLDTQTGVVLKQLPVDNAFGTSIQYESSTGRLLGIEQTYDSSTDTTTTNLVNIDQTTGAPTVIGSSWENSAGLSGIRLQQGAVAIDPTRHRFFLWTGNEILVTDTQTGVLLNQLPTDNSFGTSIAYLPPTPPIINNIAAATINKGSTYTANGSFTDNSSSSWTATINYGDGSGTNPLTLNGMNFSLNHKYNSLGTFTLTVKITGDSELTGTATTLITVIPSSTLAGANFSHTNYTGANFTGQNLSKANLSVAIFNNVDFQNANLSQVNGSNSSFINDNFINAYLNKVDFSNSNLSGSDFTNAILTQGNLSNANLTNVNFTNANLQGANLSGATITGITWSNTICPNGKNSSNNNNSCL